MLGQSIGSNPVGGAAMVSHPYYKPWSANHSLHGYLSTGLKTHFGGGGWGEFNT